MDLPDLICFAPFTTIAITELRHSPVPCAQSWVDTAMTAEQQARALDRPLEIDEIERQNAQARARWGVGYFDAANEDWTLGQMWNAPLMRHMRRQMVHGGASDRCRSSCRVLLGVEERGVDLLTRRDGELTPEIVSNRRLLLDEIRARHDRIEANPLEIAIGVSAHCNITCGFCTGPDGGYGELSEARREELIGLLPTLMNLTVSGPGEPLMSASFNLLLDHIADRGYPALSVSVTTNGTLITPRWLDRHAGVHWGHIRISVNAGSATTHERMTGKRLFDRVLDNVDAVARMRDRAGRPFRLTLSCVLSELVLGDLAGFAALVDRYQSDVALEPMTGDLGGLSPYKDIERTRALAAECRSVAETYRETNPALARAFAAMERFAEDEVQSGLVQILPRR